MGPAIAFHPKSGKMVLFGGYNGNYSNETWTWDGQTWTKLNPAQSPSARYYAAMAYDPSTGELVLAGGRYSSAGVTTIHNDTWTWDGTTWTKRQDMPGPRSFASMAWDADCGCLMLFGGNDDAQFEGENQTWTWKNGQWSVLNPAHKPSARYGAGMTQDPKTGKVVLFGGRSVSPTSTFFNDTWVWDGGDWEEASPATKPPARAGAGMAFHPGLGRVVLFGGWGQPTWLNDTWSWDGANWRQETPATKPAIRQAMAMAFDPARGEIVMFGGDASDFLNDTWTYGPPAGVKGNWRKESPATSPPPLDSASMAYDPARGETVLFGGQAPGGTRQNATWVWKNGQWTQRSPATSPSPRYGAHMVFHPRIGRIVLFGGSTASGYSDETWTWDGSNWHLEDPEIKPPGRVDGGMAVDQATGDVVLYGGFTFGGDLSDTWIWDGENWEQVLVTGPSRRSSFGFDFDPNTGRSLLFGGVGDAPDRLDETWSWGGGSWTNLSPTAKPSGRSHFPMEFNPGIGRMLMFGGFRDDARTNETWTWDGNTWRLEQPAASPDVRIEPAMAFDPGNGEMVVYGGINTEARLSDTWTYSLEVEPPKAQITSPANNNIIPIGTSVSTSFSCSEAAGGPGLQSCVDSNGANPPSGSLDTSSLGAKTYKVTATSQNGRTGEATINYTVTKATPGLWANAISNFTVGGTATLAAQLSGGYQPGGSIRIRVYGPNDPICGGSSAFETVKAVSGAGTYSAAFAPATAGTYRWYAQYLGDDNNESVSTACGGSGTFQVLKAEPALTPTGDSNGVLGEPITVGAELSGGYNPGGEIQIAIYGPDDETCSQDPAFESDSETVSGAGTYSAEFTPEMAGSYRWVVNYTGDANNQAAETDCADGSVTFEVPKAEPTLTPGGASSATLGDSITAGAELAGGYGPVGEIVFSVYGPDDETCSGAPAFESDPVAVTGEGTYESAAYVPAAVGAYRWVATYSGDANNEAVTTDCGADGSVSQVQAPPPPPPPPPVDIDPEDPPVCPDFRAESKVKRGKPLPPFGQGPKADGFLIRLRTGFDASAEVRVRVRYRVGGKRRSARLAPFAVRVNRDRILRLAVPAKMRRDFRRAGRRLRGASARVVLTARVKPQGAPASCFQKAPRRAVKVKVTGVAKRALRQ